MIEIFGLIVFALAAAVVLLTGVLKNVNWSNKVKNMLAFALSGVGAVALVYVQHKGKFTSLDVTQYVAEIYAASQVVYHFVLDNTPIPSALAKARPVNRRAAGVEVSPQSDSLQKDPNDPSLYSGGTSTNTPVNTTV